MLAKRGVQEIQRIYAEGLSWRIYGRLRRMFNQLDVSEVHIENHGELTLWTASIDKYEAMVVNEEARTQQRNRFFERKRKCQK